MPNNVQAWITQHYDELITYTEHITRGSNLEACDMVHGVVEWMLENPEFLQHDHPLHFIQRRIKLEIRRHQHTLFKHLPPSPPADDEHEQLRQQLDQLIAKLPLKERNSIYKYLQGETTWSNGRDLGRLRKAIRRLKSLAQTRASSAASDDRGCV